MVTTIGAYLLIVSFLVLERRMRRGREAAKLEAGAYDRDSTKYIGRAFAITFLMLLLAPLLNLVGIGSLAGTPLVGALGLAIMLSGLVLRYWASKTLGKFYTRTLLVTTEQQIVDTGPYRWIRHPGYLADIGLFVGAGLAALNWIGTIVIAVVILPAYIYRMRVEESMLLTSFGEHYQAYRRRSKRLIPWVY
jgi:protein-S-isoprenylcysteine O-methyltransferase Ste14